jgi:hypothetical protein
MSDSDSQMRRKSGVIHIDEQPIGWHISATFQQRL